ncbi:MAG: hypothetical protein IOD12_04285 [Silvanigrellales bacterium]|jgi:hypothetical protein|nr:hypothetical protein [Silvanigrellales bacterium]
MVQVIRPPKGANIQTGDLVNKAGIYTKPGVVIEKKDDGTVVIDTDAEQVKRFHKHSNTSGLTLEDKDKFNTIMDDIMSSESNADRINNLQMKLDELRIDPNAQKLAQALRNEQAQLIRISRELPRVYQYDSNKI